MAAASGRVVYAGAGLRGYGKLVIIKHNNTWLSAYAHNDKLLVKEQQDVRKGQKIAEMGSTDTDQVKLHFEVRRAGQAGRPGEDPARDVSSLGAVQRFPDGVLTLAFDRAQPETTARHRPRSPAPLGRMRHQTRMGRPSPARRCVLVLLTPDVVVDEP